MNLEEEIKLLKEENERLKKLLEIYKNPAKKYYEKNKDKISEYKREYYRKTKDKNNASE